MLGFSVTYDSADATFLPGAVLGGPFRPEVAGLYVIGVDTGLGAIAPFAGIANYITAAGFDLKRRNVLTPDPINPNLSIQTGEQQSRGVELEAVASLLQSRLNITAAYTYQHVRVTKSDAGNRPAIVPQSIASLYADYLVPQGMLAGLGFGGGVRYQGSTNGDQDNSFKVCGFTVFDAALHYDWRKMRFALSAKNLLDKKYVASCYSITGCNYGAARAVVGTVRYAFR